MDIFSFYIAYEDSWLEILWFLSTSQYSILQALQL